MFYVKLADGREVLVHRRYRVGAFERERRSPTRPRFTQQFFMVAGEDRAAVADQIRALHDLTAAEPALADDPGARRAGDHSVDRVRLVQDTIRHRRAVSGDRMGKGRMEAFSDGVIAIIITIMVLEMKVPHGTELAALQPLAAGLRQLCAELCLCRHLLEQPPSPAARGAQQSTGRCCGRTCICCSGCRCFRSSRDGWARTISRPLPVALYGVVLFMAAIAYTILVRFLIAASRP